MRLPDNLLIEEGSTTFCIVVHCGQLILMSLKSMLISLGLGYVARV